LRTILVDDERLALRHLRHQLSNLEQVEVVGEYTDASDAEEAAGALRPDVAFLDIEMPGMNGIMLAEQLVRQVPELKIVFVTAYDEYAVKAFEMNAMDYVLKPVSRERLRVTVERVAAARTPVVNRGRSAGGGQLPMLHVLEKLELSDPEPIAIPWRTAKTKELFAYFVLHQDRYLSREGLLDVLWPDLEQRRGFQLLSTTVYLLRRAISEHLPFVELETEDKGYRMRLRGIQLDAGIWEQSIERMMGASAGEIGDHMALIDMYRGDLLAETGYIWAEGERQRLRNLWFRHAMSLAERMVSEQLLSEALKLLVRITESFPYAEDAHFLMMKVFRRTGDHDAVKQRYELLKQLCHDEYDAPPRDEITAWYMERM